MAGVTEATAGRMQRTLSSGLVDRLRNTQRHWHAWLLLLLLGWLTLYPLAMLFLTSVRGGAGTGAALTLSNYEQAFTDPTVYGLFWTTFWLAAVRVAIAAALGISLAWVVARTNIPWRGQIEVLLWITFFMPGLPIAMGWVLLGSRTGAINWLLEKLPFVTGPVVNIYSYGGIIFVSSLQMAAFIFLLTAPVFRAMDSTLEDSARVSGAGSMQLLRRIVFPLALPGILEAVFYTFLFALESFETELILGTPARIYVFSTKIYLLAEVFPTNLPKATALSAIFVVIVFALIALRLRLLGNKSYVTITGRGYRPRLMPLGRWRWPAFGVCMLYFSVAVFLPLSILVLGSFMRVAGLWANMSLTLEQWRISMSDPRLIKAIENTVLLGILVGVLCTLIASLAVYVMVRTQFRGRRAMELVTWAPRMAPAPVLAIAFIQAYVGSTHIFRPILGTVFILALVLLVNFIPLSSRILSGPMYQVSRELEESARVSGASWSMSFRRVMLPLLAPALMTSFVLLFLFAIRNLVLVIFFYTAQSRVLSTMLWEEWQSNYMAQALTLGLLMAVLGAIALGLALFLRRRFGVSMQLG